VVTSLCYFSVLVMFQISKIYLAALCAVGFFAGSSNAAVTIVIDFDDVQADNSGSSQIEIGTSYSENGFNLTNPDNPPNFGALSYYQPGNGNYITGSGFAVFSDNPGSTVTLTEASAAEFSLTSIDIGKLTDGQTSPFSLTFVGQLAAGGTVVETETVSVTDNQFGTISFTTLNALSSVSWSQTPGHQFDNITLEVVAVPEPTSLAFLGAGLGFGVIRRVRRKRIDGVVA